MAKMILGRIQHSRDVVARRTDPSSALPYSFDSSAKRWVSKTDPSKPVVSLNLTQFIKATDTIKSRMEARKKAK